MTGKILRRALPTAFALAASAVCAQSSVTIAGRVDMSMQSLDNGAGTVKRADSGVYTASRLIFRGNEDLGGGTKAQFYLEHRFNADTGAQASAAKFWNAQAFVGLGNDSLGTITLGRQYTPAFWPFLFGDDAGPLKLHGYSALQTNQRGSFARLRATGNTLPTVGGVVGTNTGGIYTVGIASAFEDNMVLYKTPSLGGLTMMVAAAAAEGINAPKTIGANAEFRKGPLYVGWGYTDKSAVTTLGKEKVTENVVSGMFDVVPATFKVWGNIHPWSYQGVNAAKLSGRDWMLGVSYWGLGGMVWANMSDKKISSGCVDCGSKSIGIGYHYFLSKKSELYASYAKVTNANNAAAGLINATSVVGFDPKGFAAGIALTF